MKEYTEFSGT